ncbi:hypothetical protein [Curtobacterium sp. PhB136]|uniref:hypothetical protein n=1 Tax=Curtobacterium sp. PhB136 TaxID=2485181 RepID=UPI00104CA23E|nr:hypothetical protein [Curtobacterium sp. PhB136]TCK64100.1 hypothetical protein EDF27_1342 [Curtobacterium sp. PhB136]
MTVLTVGTDGLAAWPPAAVATVVAALAAAGLSLVAAIIGGLWAVLRWRQDVAREERDRYWARLTVVFELVSGDDVGRHELGYALAEAMCDMQRIPPGEEAGAKVMRELLSRAKETG